MGVLTCAPVECEFYVLPVYSNRFRFQETPECLVVKCPLSAGARFQNLATGVALSVVEPSMLPFEAS